MEELKKISYEAGVTTHKDVREAINANVDKSNSNFQEVMDVYIQDIYELDAAKINDYITNKDSKQSNNATKGYYKIPVAVKGEEGVTYGQMVINKPVVIAYIIVLGNGVITLYHYSVTFEESSNLISGITFNYQKSTVLSDYLLISDYDNTTITLGVDNPFSDSEELQAGRLYNELYGGARLSRIDSADVYELLNLDEDDDPITKHSPYEMTREYSYIYPRLYKQVTWRGYTFKNIFVLTRVLKSNMHIFYTYYFNWYPSNKYAIPGSTYYNQSWVDTPEEGNEVTVGLRTDSLFYDDSGAIYKSGGSALSKITSPDKIDAGGAQDGAYISTHDNLFYVGMWCPNERYGQAAWTTALPADGSIYPILRFDLYGFTFDDDTPVHVAIVCYLYGREIYNAGYMSLEGDVVEDVRLYVDENDRLCIYVRMDKDYYYLNWQVMAGSRNADIGESYFTDWSLATGAAAAQSIIPSLAKTEVVCTRKQIAAEATATTALNTANEANSKATNAQTAAQTAVGQVAEAKSAAAAAAERAADALAAVDGFVKNVLTFGEVTPGTYSPGARELSFTSVKAQAGDSVTFCAIINNGGQTRSGGTFLLRRGVHRYINWTEGAGIEASTGYNAVTADVTQETFATRAGIVEGRVFISALTAQIVVCDADSSNGYIIK